MEKSKVGLLPLYLELYDKSVPHIRSRVNDFVNTICKELEKRNMEVVCSAVCRIKPEFEQAVKMFEGENVDAIATLHLAYSPSLESCEVLASTKLPIIILNTTPAYVFDNQTPLEEIMFNHGIHGVQDLCNMLKRNNKPYYIESGHWLNSDVMGRVGSWVKAARLARLMRTARVGILGESFGGMGDFAVPFEDMQKTIGINTISFNFDDAKELVNCISEQEILDEIENDKRRFITDSIPFKTHYQSVKIGLALRKWLSNNNLNAFTVNFQSITNEIEFNVMPFLEIEKQMASGLGYAGEGDVLTAALSGAVSSVFQETSFTEMFCPDWKNNTIFLSHMGEMNISLASSKPELIEMDFPYTSADNPAIAYGMYKSGKVVLINLAPDVCDNYTFILAKGRIIEISGEDSMKHSIHAWFEPECEISEFLTKFSMAGGTHHSVLCYTTEIETLKKFSQIMGWNTVSI
jgi:L-arabinose isomerase